MPALIVFSLTIQDKQQFGEYQTAAFKTFAGVNFKMLAGPNPNATVEGEALDEVVVLEFPTLAEAEAWYHSPGYQDAIKLREPASKCSTFIVETKG